MVRPMSAAIPINQANTPACLTISFQPPNEVLNPTLPRRIDIERASCSKSDRRHSTGSSRPSTAMVMVQSYDGAAGHSHCRRLLMLRGESTARRHNRQPRRATPRIQCPLQCRRSLILPPQYSTIVNMARAVRTTPHHGRTACNYFSGRRVARLQQPLDPPEFMAASQRHVQLWQHRDSPQIWDRDPLAGGGRRPCVMSPPARGRMPAAQCKLLVKDEIANLLPSRTGHQKWPFGEPSKEFRHI
jgi:hypothetical protein